MKIVSLVRAAMTEGMNIFRVKRHGEKRTTILLALMIFMMFFAYSETMLASFAEYGRKAVVLSLFAALTAVLTFVEGVYKSGGLLFNCHDDDLLLSLPISRRAIVFLRLFKFYVFELAYNSLFFVPSILAYALATKPGAEFYLVAAVMVLLLPIIPIALSTVIGAITSALSARFRKSSLMQTVLSFAFMFLVMFFSFRAGSAMEDVGAYAEKIEGAITKIYYPAALFTELAESFDGLKLLGFALVNLTVAAGLVGLVSIFYFRINSRVKAVASTAMRGKAAGFARPVRRPFFAIVRKELKRFFGTPVFVTNSGFGLIMFLALVIIVCFKFDDLLTSFEVDGEAISPDMVRRFLPIATYALMAFSSFMTFMTAIMISLEGRAFNLLKTLPCSGKKVMLAKVFASLVVIWPPILIGVVIMAVRFRFGVVLSSLLVVAGVVLPAISEMIGILIDLKHAKFDAENDTEVVKQSTATLISTFLGIGLALFTMGFGAGLMFMLGAELGLVVINTIALMVLGLIYWRFSATCETRFMKLEA